MDFQIEAISRLPLHGKAVVDNVIATDVFLQRGVVHPTVALNLCAEQLDAKGVLYERHIDHALDVLSAVLVERHAKVAAPIHRHIATDNIDDTARCVLSEQRALWAAQNLNALDVKVLHQDPADGA